MSGQKTSLECSPLRAYLLHALQAKGKPITVAMFPRTEHGIYEFETKADGTRVDTRNPKGYFATRDFILYGRLEPGRYGDSTIHRPTTKSTAANAAY